MTNKELQEKLKQFPDDMTILVIFNDWHEEPSVQVEVYK